MIHIHIIQFIVIKGTDINIVNLHRVRLQVKDMQLILELTL